MSMIPPIRISTLANNICKFRLEQRWAQRTPKRARGMVVTARIANVTRSTYPIEWDGRPVTPNPLIIYAATAPAEEKIRHADEVPTAE